MEKNNKRTNKIRKGDKVDVRSGNYRGMTGTVLRVLGDKVVVQGLNIRKKHVKPNSRRSEEDRSIVD